MDYLKKYNEWLENLTIDNETKEELLKISGNDEEIKDRFYKELEFGTAGLRGIVGAGTNRMNKYTVGKTIGGSKPTVKRESHADYVKRLGNRASGLKEVANMDAVYDNALYGRTGDIDKDGVTFKRKKRYD